jgi:hypothetical protein
MRAASVPQVVEALLLRGCRQLFCTAAMSGAAVVRGAGLFDVALVDEAAQLVEAESLILLQAHPGLRKLLLVSRLCADCGCCVMAVVQSLSVPGAACASAGVCCCCFAT